MAERAVTGGGIGAGQGDDLDHMFGAEGGRGTTAGGIGQQGDDEGAQGRLGGIGRFLGGQGRLGGVPAGAPEVDDRAVEAQAAGEGASALGTSSGQDELGALDLA